VAKPYVGYRQMRRFEARSNSKGFDWMIYFCGEGAAAERVLARLPEQTPEEEVRRTAECIAQDDGLRNAYKISASLAVLRD
jgi:hypothetical protein